MHTNSSPRRRGNQQPQPTSRNAGDHQELLETQVVYWARMKGYNFWPARCCSATETKKLTDLRSNAKSANREVRVDQKPMTFFGSKTSMYVYIFSLQPIRLFILIVMPFVMFFFELLRAIVSDTAVHLFNQEHLDKYFDNKSFEKDKEYRAAVCEALLLSQPQSEAEFSGPIVDLIRNEIKVFTFCFNCTMHSNFASSH